MTVPKKTPLSQGSAYKVAAAARRAKIASMAEAIVGEVRPSQGRIRVALTGKPISRDQYEALFGPSSIEIPEFAVFRKQNSA